MRIHFNHMQTIEEVARNADQKALKQLDLLERKVLKSMMQALQKGKGSVEIEGFGEKQLETLKGKLLMPSGVVSKSFGQKLSIFAQRLSTSTLKNEIKKADAILNRRRERLAEVEERLAEVEKRILVTSGIISFNETVIEHADFLHTLADNPQKANLQLTKQMKKVEEPVIQSNLKQLKKWTAYPGRWGRELETQRSAWGKTAQDIQKFDVENKILQREKLKFQKLKEERTELWSQLGLSQKLIPLKRAAIKRKIGEFDLLREVPINLGKKLMGVWKEIRHSSNEHLLDQAILNAKKELSALKGQPGPIEEAKRRLLQHFQKELLSIRWEGADPAVTAERNFATLSQNVKEAHEQMDGLLFSIAKSRGKVGRVERG